MHEGDVEDHVLEDTTVALESIRHLIREQCLNDQSKWELSWKSVLADSSSRGSLLPVDLFLDTLNANNINLSKSALNSLLNNYQAPNGSIRVASFLQWINISKPRDYIDPELVQARLPQPYRRITKVLEQDILDVAWACIQATSVRYKAETSAALSARGLTNRMQPEELLDVLEDDYTRAKKRCCVSTPVPLSRHIEAIQAHKDSPIVLVVLAYQRTEDTVHPLSFQLIDTLSQKMVLEPVLINTQGDNSSETSELTTDRVLSIQLSSRTRRAENTEPQVLTAVIHVETTGFTSTTSVWIYDILNVGDGNYRLVRTIVKRATSTTERLNAVHLSYDATVLAIASSKQSSQTDTVIYSLPSPSTEETLNVVDLATFSPVTIMTTSETVSAIYFLHAPKTQRGNLPSVYAVAIVTGSNLIKYRLDPTLSSPPILQQSWSHLTTITTSSLNYTTQFVSVGLSDGSAIVWNLVEDWDHVVLRSNHSHPIDTIYFHDSVIITFSSTAQEVCFYDVSNHAVPLLRRVVTPPTSPTTVASTTCPTKITSITPYPTYELPLVLVSYSNGYRMLYDFRDAEAIGSMKSIKTVLTSPCVMSTQCITCVGTTESSLDIYHWFQLLTTYFPKLIVTKQDPENSNWIKQQYHTECRPDLASSLSSLTIDSKSTLHSILLSTASNKSSIHDLLGSKQSYNFGSRHETLSSFLDPYPYLPDPTIPYKTFTKEQENKLHRRRHELLKLLTLPW